ncbi:MAG TPA: hypothetical protein VMT03_04425 [Polyangia bacterium]|nr:hypothetical protein [Polyangia bacterium]
MTPRPPRLCLCPEFVGPEWQLPLLPGAERTLIGWAVDPEPVDAGVPPVVADILSTALCRHATLNYPTGLTPLRWKSTRDPREATAGVFEGDVFSWDLQGQVVVLSSPGTSPRLNQSHLEVGTDPALIDQLERLGAIGLLLPGVDGDVAGLYTFAPLDMRALEGALATAVRNAGGELISVDEADFSAHLVSTRPRA